MPTLPSPGLVIRAQWYTADESGIPAGSRVYFSYHGSPITQGNINSLASNIAASWVSDLAGYVATTDTLTEVICQDLSSNTGVVGVAAVSDAGTRSGTAMPSNIAANIGHIIGRHYRGGKPKTFLRAGVVADLHSSDDNQWSAAFISGLKTQWQAFVTDVLATSGANLSNIVNVGYYGGFTSVLNPVTGRTRDVPKVLTTPNVDVITDAIVRPKLGSQRRRLTL
jgi:hypothetical protein